jgi:hypothetical protein
MWDEVGKKECCPSHNRFYTGLERALELSRAIGRGNVEVVCFFLLQTPGLHIVYKSVPSSLQGNPE